MFTIDTPKHPIFGEVVVAPHPPTRTYHARLIHRQPDRIAHRLPIDPNGHIVCPIMEDVSLDNLLLRLQRRLGDFDVDKAVVKATIAWIPFTAVTA